MRNISFFSTAIVVHDHITKNWLCTVQTDAWGLLVKGLLVNKHKTFRAELNRNEMYPQSSQKKFWTFQNEQQLRDLREKHNQEYIFKHGQEIEVNESLFG